MDPLGAVPTVVDHNTLRRWGEGDPPQYDIMLENPANQKKSPFVWNKVINAKISLWVGDIAALNAEAIVNVTNETLQDHTPACDRILAQAGPLLRHELKTDIKTCRTGESKITKGYKLPARFVIHTVGPRYNIKYKTAAESALYNSYRSVLQTTREKNISSLGLCNIHTSTRSYPPHEGAHIAIRTVRRFLEKYGDNLQHVIFVVCGMHEIYESLFPLYFPRNQSEEDFAAYHLPGDVGNEDGEPVIADRQIRILGKPTHEASKNNISSGEELEESININEALEFSVAVGNHSFSKMEADVDCKRCMRVKQDTLIKTGHNVEHKRYERWLKRAKLEDLSEISSLRCLYQSGFDKYGRPVVVFVGRNLPAGRVNMDKALLYFLYVMDSIVNKQYVVVYVHTETVKDNQPEPDFLRTLYELVDSRYRNNLGAIYILHATLWSKVMTWLFTTFSLSELKPKVHHIPGLEYLYQRIPPDQLDLPQFVSDYDLRTRGTRYYDPDEDQAIGAL